jgi:hypothetical protein
MIGLSNALFPSIDGGGLQVAVAPAKLWLNGFIIVLPPSIIFVSPNATSYIFLNTSTAMIGVSTAGYSSIDIPIATVITDSSRCVSMTDTRPDFTNVGGSGPGINFADAERPTGAINGSNVTFTLLNAPSPPSSLFLVRNGVVLQPMNGFTLSSETITVTIAPSVSDSLEAWYRY